MDLIYLSRGSSNADSSKSSFDMDGSVPHEQVSAVVVSKADPLAERRRAKALKVQYSTPILALTACCCSGFSQLSCCCRHHPIR